MMSELEVKLVEDVAKFVHNPLGYVMYAFPWGEPGTILENETGPDGWQIRLLKKVGKNCKSLKHALNRVHRYSRGSGNGIGKSAVVAWLILWA